MPLKEVLSNIRCLGGKKKLLKMFHVVGAANKDVRESRLSWGHKRALLLGEQ